MTEFKIPYRETEDYIANSVALIALEKYKESSSNLFSISDLGCGEGIILHSIVNKITSSGSHKPIKVNVIDINNSYIKKTIQKLKSIKSSILTVSSDSSCIFQKPPETINSDFVYVFWRISDIQKYPWTNIRAKTIVSYKHPIKKLENKLQKIIKSKSLYRQFENLYVYQLFI
jgi:hypothetical protein